MSEEVQTELPFDDQPQAYTILPVDYKECLRQLLDGLGVDSKRFMAEQRIPGWYKVFGVAFRKSTSQKTN